MIYKNPFKNKKKLEIVLNRRKPWSQQVFDKFLERSTNNFYAQVCEFLWMTGLRPGEAASLRWTDIDRDNGTITVRSGKNLEYSRQIYIFPKLDEFLHNIPMNSNFVFAQNGLPFRVDCLSHHCRKMLRSLNLGQYCLYGIRHGFGTRLDQMGVSAFQIAALMGHRQMQTTKIYVHHDKNQLIDVLKRAN